MFFYLLSVVPAIWFLELHQLERRIEEERLIRNKTLELYQLGNATAYREFVNNVPVLKVRQYYQNNVQPVCLPLIKSKQFDLFPGR